MSYFDDASLVMIPSGYKTSKVYSIKPTDGSGDLAFTRSNDTATRVGPDGLIEKVRTNLVLQSNAFSTTWTLDDATLTSGQSGYDGTNNAWRLAKTAAGGRVQQSLSLSSNSHTFSVYVKAGTKNWVFLRIDGTSNRTSYFDLQNGVVGTASGCTPSIVSAGNGWYRCSISYVDTTTSVRIWVADADGDISGTSGNILIQAAQTETGDIATDYIATTSAAVSVGPVANVPRLDYLNSSCPRLLLEPQRTNLALYSEQFNNAAWVLDGDGAGQSVTANYAISPDGYQNADRIQLNKTGGSYSRIRQSFTAAYSGATTFSVYLKTNDATTKTAYLRINGSTSTLITITGSWTRFSITDSWIFSLGFAAELFLDTGSSTTADISAYGAQVEAGAYATSYIPTLGAAVTRGADAASKTGISSLIGQTAGTIFVDFVWNGLQSPAAVDAAIFSIGVQEYGTSSIAISNYNGTMYARVTNGVTVEATINFGSLVAGTRYKAALAYANNDVVFYVNGASYGSDTSASIPAISDVNFQNPYPNAKGVNQAILFPTRLSNSDLAALTA